MAYKRRSVVVSPVFQHATAPARHLRISDSAVFATPPLYDTREGAEAELQRIMVKNGDRVTKVHDLPDCMTQLRKIRSAHHPDRNNPDSDHDLYQAVVEKIDRIRAVSA